MVVTRFRWLGWFALCVGVVLGCYLMSSQVAAERNKLADVERAIARTQRDIRALETEFDTRSNLAQLERWNGDTLKLSAPTAAQYVRDDAQLAMLGQPQVQNAAAVIPSAPAATIETTPASVTASLPAKAAARPVRAVLADAAARPQPSAAKTRAQMAMLDRRIMGGSSLGDLMRRVDAEGGRQ
ncbi:MAG: hypothetical protein JSR79_00670 [Proteobacteria bacterium]|nr:hypothetical protein [Pseudomonadota bacterium]